MIKDTGILEGWNNGILPFFPLFHYSIIPFNKCPMAVI